MVQLSAAAADVETAITRRHQMPNHSPASTSWVSNGQFSPVALVVASLQVTPVGAVDSLAIVWIAPVVSLTEGASTAKLMSSCAFPVSAEIHTLQDVNDNVAWLFRNPTARYSVSPAEDSAPDTSSNKLLSAPDVMLLDARKFPSEALGSVCAALCELAPVYLYSKSA